MQLMLCFGFCHIFTCTKKSELREEMHFKSGQIPPSWQCQDKSASTHQQQLWLVWPRVRTDALERNRRLEKVLKHRSTTSGADTELRIVLVVLPCLLLRTALLLLSGQLLEALGLLHSGLGSPQVATGCFVVTSVLVSPRRLLSPRATP